MKVLLRKDIDGVGRRGDIVDVKGGYARNFLLPSGSALVASDTLADQASSMRRSRDLKDAKDLAAAATQKSAIERSKVTIPARASAQGKLFGSVGPVEVAAALSATTGVEVDRAQVVLEEHLKELGERQVAIRLFGDVEATATVEVVALA
jgi:large subunit ribosomal protein L9